jgi:hypothetical protein
VIAWHIALHQLPSHAMNTSASTGQGNQEREHDQDSDPPRTAVPPDSPDKPGQPPASKDPNRDPDSDPPRTPVLP